MALQLPELVAGVRLALLVPVLRVAIKGPGGDPGDLQQIPISSLKIKFGIHLIFFQPI